MGAWCEDHVGAAPRLVVGELPAVTATGGVFRIENVAWMEGEVWAGPCLEIQRACERDHELPRGRGMPGEGATGFGFLERDGDRAHRAGQQIPPRARLEIQHPLLEVGVVFIAGPQPYASDHQGLPQTARSLLAGSRRFCDIRAGICQFPWANDTKLIAMSERDGWCLRPVAFTLARSRAQ